MGSALGARRADEAHAEHGVGYVAAPVFGRVPVAEAGALNILAAGEQGVIDRVQPLLDVIGSRTWRLGDRPEQANTVKILGNYLIACAIQSLGEAVSVAEGAGVDSGQFVELLTSTLFPGAVYSGYGSMIAERRYQPAGFTALLGRKDLHLALDAANDHGIRLPVGALLRAAFAQAIADGGGADDWAVIAEQQPR
ncbi:NAD(P)-dependent oxidoreductase [Streptomyces hydrogenans]|uniref:NAD(P)-dependent oxidoreductase n=1 Tax=Streptomyces hydrogenans TaxID=1873719 RepID=UPI00381B04A8